MRRGLRTALMAIAAVVGLLVAAGLWWALTPLGPSEVALAALESDAAVAVISTDAGLVFSPASTEPTAALVIYPGGRVDYRSYAPLARELAEAGHLVVVTPMPLSLAVLDPNAANDAITAHPEIDTWVVGGHSLGGAMAAQYAADNLDSIDGLLLMAAYPTDRSDLSASKLPIADVVGTLDGVLTWDTWEAARTLLPAKTQIVRIEGGNHAQFGDYGAQPGDNPATISSDEQRRQAAQAAMQLIGDAGAR